MTLQKKGRGPLRVDYVPIGKVKPSKNNTRTHSPAQIDAIRKSIEAVGWTKPIIVDDKFEILAGHGAYMAAQQAGMTEVPIIQRSGLTSAMRRAYRIADNKLAEKSEWDTGMLAAEFADLQKMGFDMSLTGFDQADIDFMLKPPPTDPGEPPAPELTQNPISKKGDLWLLGDHRIICGDSTKRETYDALMEGRKAQLVFTDPPYGVTYQGRGLDKLPILKGDDKRRGELLKMITGALSEAMPHTRESAAWYIWHADKTRDDFSRAMNDVGLIENGMIIWEKTASMGWQDYRNSHEPCFYAARQGVKPLFNGDRTNTTVWRLEGHAVKGLPTSIGNGLIVANANGEEIYISAKVPPGKKLRHLIVDKETPLLLQSKTDADDVWAVSRDVGHGKDNAFHPTMKPVELGRRACRNSANEGDIVLDMFGGSCSTVMAAEQTGRIGYAIELDPRYVDASVRRWQTMTGKQATHASEKKTFEAIAKARGKG